MDKALYLMGWSVKNLSNETDFVNLWFQKVRKIKFRYVFIFIIISVFTPHVKQFFLICWFETAFSIFSKTGMLIILLRYLNNSSGELQIFRNWKKTSRTLSSILTLNIRILYMCAQCIIYSSQHFKLLQFL